MVEDELADLEEGSTEAHPAPAAGRPGRLRRPRRRGDRTPALSWPIDDNQPSPLLVGQSPACAPSPARSGARRGGIWRSRWSASGLRVTDLESTNGTYFSGLAVRDGLARRRGDPADRADPAARRKTQRPGDAPARRSHELRARSRRQLGDAAAVSTRRAAGGVGHPAGDRGRDRHRQGGARRGDSRAELAGGAGRSWSSTARPRRHSSWKSDLFGHERGAFTGAVAPAQGGLRAGPRRDPSHRRDRRARCGAAAEAPARHRALGDPAGRLGDRGGASTCGSSRRPAATSTSRCRSSAFETISSTGWRSAASSSRRCAGARADVHLAGAAFLEGARRRA